jgi:hypothetical protein
MAKESCAVIAQRRPDNAPKMGRKNNSSPAPGLNLPTDPFSLHAMPTNGGAEFFQ